MIQIEDVREIPRLLWNETSSKEFALMPYESHQLLLDFSSPIKMLRNEGKPLLVAGLFRKSFLSTPYLWALLTDEFRNAPPSILRGVARVIEALAPRCETLIEQGNKRAERLARAFKFSPTEGVMLMGDQYYRLYRRG